MSLLIKLCSCKQWGESTDWFVWCYQSGLGSAGSRLVSSVSAHMCVRFACVSVCVCVCVYCWVGRQFDWALRCKAVCLPDGLSPSQDSAAEKNTMIICHKAAAFFISLASNSPNCPVQASDHTLTLLQDLFNSETLNLLHCFFCLFVFCLFSFFVCVVKCFLYLLWVWRDYLIFSVWL